MCNKSHIYSQLTAWDDFELNNTYNALYKLNCHKNFQEIRDTHIKMESDAVKQWLNQMVEKSDQRSVNDWTIQIVFKKVARFLTAAVVIATVFISIGILISRGWVCYSK